MSYEHQVLSIAFVFLTPFYTNDTAAYLIDDSFTKEEVTKLWYMRRDDKIAVDIPAWADVISIKDLDMYEWYNDNWERHISKDILKKVIQDEKGDVYKIVPLEYEFLMKHGLPLPRLHWLERMKMNFRIG